MRTHLIRYSWTGAEHAWCGALPAEEGGPEPNSEMWDEVDCERCLELAALFGRRANNALVELRDRTRQEHMRVRLSGELRRRAETSDIPNPYSCSVPFCGYIGPCPVCRAKRDELP